MRSVWGREQCFQKARHLRKLRLLCQALTLDHIAHHHHLHPSSSECHTANNNNNKTTTTTTTNNNSTTTNILSLYTPIAKSPDKHHLSFGTVIGSSRVASSKGKTWAPLRGAKWISPFKCLGLKIWKRWRFWCTVMQNEPKRNTNMNAHCTMNSWYKAVLSKWTCSIYLSRSVCIVPKASAIKRSTFNVELRFGYRKSKLIPSGKSWWPFTTWNSGGIMKAECSNEVVETNH